MSKEQKQLELFKRTRSAMYIRFKPEELLEIERLAKERGEKPQNFVKSCVFNEGNSQPILSLENTRLFLNELKRIGNNFNQIARHMNSGHKKDWYDYFQKCSDDLMKVKHILVGHVAS